ncbi:MAG: biotin/lipoyl-binding protein [bacterium]
MKNKIISIFQKPKIVISASMVVAIIIGASLYNYVGNAPSVVLPLDQNLAISVEGTSSNSVNLAFVKAGRVATVTVRSGDIVKAGDVLATLEADDAKGAVNQARGSLELAKAQYASLNVQYASAKKQQDVLVANAYRTMLSSNLIAVGKDNYNENATVDNSLIPQISGTYTCEKEGEYVVAPYSSGVVSGYSFNVTGLEDGNGSVTYFAPQPLGSCGLFIQFPSGYYSASTKWVISIPNKRSVSYVANRNAYDLAVTTRNQVLSQLEANLGKNGSSEANIAQATINSVQGSYEIALAAYKNYTIVAPMDGVVSFVDSHLKIGESAIVNKTLLTIVKQ